jgi:hypothetical protein
MILGIYFDESTRSFSTIEDREFGDKLDALKGHLGKNSRAYIDAASGLVGGAGGALIARAQAKKAAEKAGLKPGTPEYKKFIAKRMAIGTAAGAVAGGAASELTRAGVATAKGAKELMGGSHMNKKGERVANGLPYSLVKAVKDTATNSGAGRIWKGKKW